MATRSHFCFPFRFRKTAAGCSIPLYQQIEVETTVDQKEKGGHHRINDSGPPFEM
jgi:hypothetical protein